MAEKSTSSPSTGNRVYLPIAGDNEYRCHNRPSGHTARAMTIAGTDSAAVRHRRRLRAFAACGVHGCLRCARERAEPIGVTGVHTDPAGDGSRTDPQRGRRHRAGRGKTACWPAPRLSRRWRRRGPGRDRGRRGTPLGDRPGCRVHDGDQLLADSALDAFRTLLSRGHGDSREPGRGSAAHRPGRDDRAGVRGGQTAARAGAEYVLVKGGHLRRTPTCAWICSTTAQFTELPGPVRDRQHPRRRYSMASAINPGWHTACRWGRGGPSEAVHRAARCGTLPAPAPGTARSSALAGEQRPD